MRFLYLDIRINPNGAPTYRKNEHGNIQGKQTGIVLRGGIAVVGLQTVWQAVSRAVIVHGLQGLS